MKAQRAEYFAELFYFRERNRLSKKIEGKKIVGQQSSAVPRPLVVADQRLTHQRTN